jgi:3',5'-cyclic AMP phosphodiesterase CpdA
MLIAQISDLHMRPDASPLSGAVVTRPYTVAAVNRLLGLRPDAVLVTGDLTDIGTAEEYALVRAELDRLPCPVLAIPGNHDRPEEMRRAFADHAHLPAEGPLDFEVELGGLRLIGLDSVVPGAEHGMLAPESLAFLDRALSQETRPAVVAVHHPPFRTGMIGMDRIGLLNGPEMAAVIARHPHVERVLCGHHHRPVQVRWAGTLGQIAPSVAHQVALDLSGGANAWTREPPALLLHVWREGAGLITHTVYTGDYDGPHPMELDPDYPGLG